MKRVRFLTLMLGAALMCLPVFATETPSAIQMDTMVVTASKALKTAGNVTQKVDVISKERIDAIVMGNGNIAELLTYQPGVAVSALSRNDANWGAVGGLSQKYNTYMINGLPIDGFVEPQSLDAAAFERIEIQRGPASVLYPNYLSMDFSGNQSPLTGTTNLILKDRIDAPRTSAEAYYGSYNTFGARVYHQQAAGNFHLFFGGSHETSDYTDYGTKNSWLNMIDDPEYRKTKLYLNSTVFFNDRNDHKLSVFVNHTRHDGDVGRPNRDYDHEYITSNAAYTLAFSDTATLSAKLGYRMYDRTWEEDNYPANIGLASFNGAKQRIVPGDVALSLYHANGSLLTVGSDFQNMSYQTYSETTAKQVGNDADALQYGLYAQEELAFDRLLIRIGARYAYTKHDIDLLSGTAPGNDSQSWNELLWSAGTKYNMTGGLSFYANVGTSFVAPSLKAVGGTIPLSDEGVVGRDGQLPNPDLEPEKGLAYDLGVDFSGIEDITMGVRGFYNIVDDQIVDVVVHQTPSQTRSINAGDQTKSYGLELAFRHSPLASVSWFANYTYTHSEIESGTDPDQDGAEVPFVPENMANIGVDLNLPADIFLSLYLHWSGEIYDSNSKSGRSKFDAYEVLNLSARKTLIHDEDRTVDLFMDLYNLTNNEYEMPWQFQNPGLSATGGVKITF